MKKTAYVLAALLVVSGGLLLPGGCKRGETGGTAESGETQQTAQEPVAAAADSDAAETAENGTIVLPDIQPGQKFGEYVPYVFNGKRNVPAYTWKEDLSDVENLNQYTDSSYYYYAGGLGGGEMKKLAEAGFVVDDSSSHHEYFGLYESNRYDYAPNFVTVDSAVHTFHLLYDYILKDTERSILSGLLRQLSLNMVSASQAQYDALKGTPFENAAKRNVAFFSVGAKILSGKREKDAFNIHDFKIPSYVQDSVGKELDLINASDGITLSPIMEKNEDYSQFIPRGHYDLEAVLRNYFRAQMWYGRMTFLSKNEDEVRSALLICSALKNGENEKLWYALFEPINFFVGECDDITFLQYEKALKGIYGDKLGDTAVVSDEAKFTEALALVRSLPPPEINSMPIFNSKIEPDRNSEISGFRFLGQRFTIDASIFQRLMDRETKGRMLPKALDIPAVFGSTEAEKILKDMGEMEAYPEYGPNLSRAKEYLEGIPEKIWTSNVYWAWLYMLRPLAKRAGTEGLPRFMQSDAWTRKSLLTFLGSWTELKHDTILYAKQPVAEMGGGGPEPPPPPDDGGYVEPEPEVFGRLAALAAMTQDGLEKRGILTPDAAGALTRLTSLSQRLTEIAETELAGKSLTAEHYATIKTYGGELEHMFRTAKRDEIEASETDFENYLAQFPAAIVADVATDPNGSVLEEATGYAKTIYVIFPRKGKAVIGSGTVYSQYEFTVPLSQRMTDSTWHETLRSGDEPPPAGWQLLYLANAAGR